MCNSKQSEHQSRSRKLFYHKEYILIESHKNSWLMQGEDTQKTPERIEKARKKEKKRSCFNSQFIINGQGQMSSPSGYT